MANDRRRDAAGGPRGPDRGGPFGSWTSPFSARSVAAGKVSRSGLHADGDTFAWSESRPGEGGRQVVVVAPPGRPPEDRSPVGVSVRTRVHEYGGGAATLSGGALFYVDQADQRLHRDAPGEGTRALTPPAPPGRTGNRYADGRVAVGGDWFVCVEEGPAGEGPAGEGARHRIVAVATDGSGRVVPLVDDGGFVAAPRPSPDGIWLAWTAWSRPDMPWDRSTLWVARLGEEGGRPRLAGRHLVAGGDAVSVGQPLWCPDGSLVYVADPTGWWLPYRLPPGRVGEEGARGSALVDVEAEFHAPDWAFGQATLAVLADGSLACRYRRGGRDRLARLRRPAGDLAERGHPWTMEDVDQPCVTIAGVVATADGTRVAVLGSTPTLAAGVFELVPDERRPPRLLTPPAPVDERAVSVAEPFVADGAAGAVPGLFYPPAGGAGGAGGAGLPPLVVFCHGGPTGAAEPGFDPVVQFFASRGLAVAAVDYRGSTGYGRAYRERLRGQWGVADVDDCVAFAASLARAGRVDAGRMAIRGTSAGGFTALAALVRSDRFAGAAAWYGVTDLEALAADTHDFEAGYLDGLVGPLPEARATYRERSPISHPERVSGDVLLLQGADDPVVPADQAERFAAALGAHGVRCRLELFAGESHGFRRSATVEACLVAELAFYGSLFGFDPAPGPPGPDPEP